MNSIRTSLRPNLTLTAWAVALVVTAAAQAQGPVTAETSPSAFKAAAASPAHPTAPAAPSSAGKDIVLDTAAAEGHAAAREGSGRLVPTPGNVAASVPQTSPIYTSPLHDAAASAALADLGLHAIRQLSAAQGQADFNAAVSPLSVATALGLVHAGASGETRRELATLLSAAPAGSAGFTARLPSVLSRLGGAKAPVFTMANRIWLRRDVAPNAPASYLETVRVRYGADAASLDFGLAEGARQAINTWTAEKTRQRITDLLPAGSLTAATKLVATNAIHFKSPWASPFDPAATQALPFKAAGRSKSVPTMVDERAVLHGSVDNLSVFELPFADRAYALMIAMPQGQHTMNGLEQDLTGLDMAAWSSQLKESVCQLQLPRFHIDAPAISLRATLQGLGVRRAFTDQAELQPLLGPAAGGVGLDDVFHRATVTIDEFGGEASAATAVTAQAKSLSMPAPSCAIDRPFIFAIVHKPTGTSLFVGKVVDPAEQFLVGK